MVLPLIVGAAALIAGAAGAGSGVRGGMKMKDAKDTSALAKRIQEDAVELLDRKGSETNKALESIGKQEPNILSSFSNFSDVIEKVQGRPEFKEYKNEDLNLKIEKVEDLRDVSIGAGMILGTAGGLAVGTASSIAAGGATPVAVASALGIPASTGTAISGLSGAAATNATLAALGGGSLATGGGGIALGTTILGGATLGVGLLAGGAILGAVGSKMSKDADEMYRQAKRAEEKAQRVAETYDEIISTAKRFQIGLTDVENEYKRHFSRLENIVNFYGKTQWVEFTESEKQVTQNTVLLVGMLYKMCQVSLVQKTEETELDEQEIKANIVEVDAAYNDSVKVLRKVRNQANESEVYDSEKINDTKDLDRVMQYDAIELIDKKRSEINKILESIGRQKLKILSSLNDFSDVIKKIQGLPEFKECKTNHFEVPFTSMVADILMTAKLILVSPIDTLGEEAATTIAVSVAIEPKVLAASSTVQRMLRGVANEILKDGDEMYFQSNRLEGTAQKVAKAYDEIMGALDLFQSRLKNVEKEYKKHFSRLDDIVNFYGKAQWVEFTETEKQVTQKTVLLVGMLYKMCQVSVVQKIDKNELDEPKIKANTEEIYDACYESRRLLEKIS